METRKAKQSYLRSEIIDENYDIKQFSEFMDKEKVDGQDIDQWDILGLEIAVQKFKSMFDPLPQEQDLDETAQDFEELKTERDQEHLQRKRLTTRLLKLEDQDQSPYGNPRGPFKKKKQETIIIKEEALLKSNHKDRQNYQLQNYQTQNQGKDPLSQIQVQQNYEIDNFGQRPRPAKNPNDYSFISTSSIGNLDSSKLLVDTENPYQKNAMENYFKVQTPTQAATITQMVISNLPVESRNQTQKGVFVLQDLNEDKLLENNQGELMEMKIDEEKQEFHVQRANFLDIQQYKIKIDEHKVIDKGVMSLNYVVYRIEVKELGIDVYRRYNDFHWLHQNLKKTNPHIFVPPLIKKTKTRSTAAYFINKRKSYFKKFLTQVTLQPQLKSSKFFKCFLETKNQEEFELLQQQLTEDSKTDSQFNKINDIALDFNPKMFRGDDMIQVQDFPSKNLAGPNEAYQPKDNVSCISQAHNIFSQELKELVSQSSKIFKNMKKVSKQLMVSLNDTKSKLDLLSSFSLGLSQVQEKYLNKVKKLDSVSLWTDSRDNPQKSRNIILGLQGMQHLSRNLDESREDNSQHTQSQRFNLQSDISLNNSTDHTHLNAEVNDILKMYVKRFDEIARQNEIKHKAYMKMGESFLSWSNSIKNQLEYVSTCLYKEFSYSQDECLAMGDLIKTRDKLDQEYFESWIKLDNLKTKLFLTKYTSKYQLNQSDRDKLKERDWTDRDLMKSLMMPTQTKEAQNLREVFGFFNQQVVEQSEHFNQKSLERECGNMVRFVIGLKKNNSSINRKLVKQYEDWKNMIAELGQKPGANTNLPSHQYPDEQLEDPSYLTQ